MPYDSHLIDMLIEVDSLSLLAFIEGLDPVHQIQITPDTLFF